MHKTNIKEKSSIRRDERLRLKKKKVKPLETIQSSPTYLQ